MSHLVAEPSGASLRRVNTQLLLAVKPENIFVVAFDCSN